LRQYFLDTFKTHSDTCWRIRIRNHNASTRNTIVSYVVLKCLVQTHFAISKHVKLAIRLVETVCDISKQHRLRSMEERIEGVCQNFIGAIANEDVVYVELER
jgi:hypothetical protein